MQKSLIGMAVIIVVAVLARPQLTVATAARVRYIGCVPTLNRQVAVRGNQEVTFRVVSETDTTLTMEKPNLKRALKANKPEFVTITLPSDAGWYAFKLTGCHASGYLGVLQKDGKLPPMALTYGDGHDTSNKKSDDRAAPSPSTEHMH